MTKSAKVVLYEDGQDVFIVVNDVKIAVRGKPGSAHTWVSLEPGWTVTGGPGHISVTYEGVRVH